MVHQKSEPGSQYKLQTWSKSRQSQGILKAIRALHASSCIPPSPIQLFELCEFPCTYCSPSLTGSPTTSIHIVLPNSYEQAAVFPRVSKRAEAGSSRKRTRASATSAICSTALVLWECLVLSLPNEETDLELAAYGLKLTMHLPILFSCAPLCSRAPVANGHKSPSLKIKRTRM